MSIHCKHCYDNKKTDQIDMLNGLLHILIQLFSPLSEPVNELHLSFLFQKDL